jgi:hypothetical protein
MAHTFNPDVSFEVEHRPAAEGHEPHAVVLTDRR